MSLSLSLSSSSSLYLSLSHPITHLAWAGHWFEQDWRPKYFFFRNPFFYKSKCSVSIKNRNFVVALFFFQASPSILGGRGETVIWDNLLGSCTDWDAAGSKYGRPLVSTLNSLCRRSFYVQADIDHLEVVLQNLTLSPNTECTILTNIILGEKKRNRAICWFSIQLLSVINSNSLQLTSKKRHFVSLSRSCLDWVETNCRVFNTNAPLSLSTSSSSKTLQVVDSTWLSIRALNQGGCSRRIFQLFRCDSVS